MYLAAKQAGGTELFDNGSMFLLHLWQAHWIPELWLLLSGLHTRDVLDNAKFQLMRLQSAVNKAVVHYHLALSDFLKPDTLDQQTSHLTKPAVDTYTMW